MSGTVLAQLAPAAPEIFLAVAGMALLMLGVFKGDGATRMVTWLAVLAFAIAAFLLWGRFSQGRAVGMNGLFVSDAFWSTHVLGCKRFAPSSTLRFSSFSRYM